MQRLDDRDGARGAAEVDPVRRRHGGRTLCLDSLEQRGSAQLGLRQHTGKTPRGEMPRAQALLGLAARLEGHQHGGCPGGEEVGGRVVAALADRERGTGQQGPVVRPGASDDARRQAVPDFRQQGFRHAVACENPPAEIRPLAGGIRSSAQQEKAGRPGSGSDQHARARRGWGRARPLIHVAGIARLAGRRGVERPGGVKRHKRRIAVNQNGVVEGGHAGMGLRDPLEPRRSGEDVAHGGEDQRARHPSDGRLHQGQELRRQRPAAEGEQLGQHRVGREGRECFAHPVAAAREPIRIRGRPVRLEQIREGRADDVQRRQLDDVYGIEAHQGGRHPAGNQHHLMAGRHESPGQGGGAGQVAGTEQMGDGDQDAHAETSVAPS